MAPAIDTTANRVRSGLRRCDEFVSTSHGAAQKEASRMTDRMPIMGEIRLIGGALVFLLLITFVLTEIFVAVEFEEDADGNYEGPFGEVAEDLESLGAVAMSLLVLGLLVVAAAAIMRFFGRSGFGGR